MAVTGGSLTAPGVMAFISSCSENLLPTIASVSISGWCRLYCTGLSRDICLTGGCDPLQRTAVGDGNEEGVHDSYGSTEFPGISRNGEISSVVELRLFPVIMSGATVYAPRGSLKATADSVDGGVEAGILLVTWGNLITHPIPEPEAQVVPGLRSLIE
jgi:hypothetical protein